MAFCQRAIDELARTRAIREALLLGVTPEIHGLNWPDGSRLRAVDRSAQMIALVWPGPPENVFLGEWQNTPFDDGVFDIAFCDGGLSLTDYPDGQSRLVAELTRLIAPGGHAIFRLFLPPVVPERPEDVIAALAAGKIRNMNCLKLRLGHAMTRSPEEGVMLDDIWRYLHDATGDCAIGDRDDFFAKLGWLQDEVTVIDFYRNSSARYHFVDLPVVERLFAGPFRTIDVTRHDHLMGDQCAHIRLERL